jgi:hypothetical protein
MSAELRNRIYDFAKEAGFATFAPPPLFSTSKPATSGRPFNVGRRFFALTQTSKQIRSEFRPLWLRGSSIRIKFDDIDRFIDTFYGTVAEYDNAPKLLIISWDDHYDEDSPDDLDDVLFDVAPLLRLRAFCPTSSINFVPHRLSEFDLPNARCGDCGHSLYCDCNSKCEHEDVMEKAHDILNDIYSYTEALDEILANNTEAWLGILRGTSLKKTMRVEFTVDTQDRHLTVFIRFHYGLGTSKVTKKDMYGSAVKFLHDMGLLGLEYDYMIEFVVGEATGKFARHSEYCDIAVPMYDQIEISGETIYETDNADGTETSS